MHDFNLFKSAVAKQFERMRDHDLFCVDVGRDELWAHYIESFPEGTNPMYRARREHDCSCCRQFIRTMGGVVAVIDGEIATIWDGIVGDDAYDIVGHRMIDLVGSRPIRDVFVHYEQHVGTDHNYENNEVVGGNGPLRWNHFSAVLPARRNEGRACVAAKKNLATIVGEARSLRDVFLRSLTEITRDAIDAVLEIIDSGALYRGSEHKFAVYGFSAQKAVFDQITSTKARERFAWATFDKVHASVARIRNTAIGTLLQDISQGLELEDAVRKFETSVMAPVNYKRPTALVSKKMVDDARAKVEALGLTTALDRRRAVATDIPARDVLFADHTARDVMRDGDVFAGVGTKRSQTVYDGVSVPIENFIRDVLPAATSVEVMFENRHTGNLVSLLSPLHADAKLLFKWNNNFSWAYRGDVTDSIKERVKKAGGNVTGDLCCRLAWHNHDDLDLHMVEARQKPGSSYEIYYGNHGSPSPSGGNLDVDMNAGVGITREPVENIFYGTRAKMRPGFYELVVHQYAKRESVDVGFEVEIDWLGTVRKFSYDKPVRQGERLLVASMRYDGKDIKWVAGMPHGESKRMLWGVQTQDWAKVLMVMRSPNHWDGEHGTGNRHYLFMLDGCVSDEPARGYYNEFLRDELCAHSKVLELVSGRTQVAPSTGELSGLGFSDTQRAEITVKVGGKRTYRVRFKGD